jgi:ETC complex I subunit conserved region
MTVFYLEIVPRLDSSDDSRKGKAMTARIYQPPKNAMQSGKAHADQWILEFVPAEARRADPLMGWSGSGDTQVQVVLKFASQQDAAAYATKHGIDVRVAATPPKRLKIQAYADNFR